MVPDKNGFPQWEFGKDWAWKSSYASRDLFLIISANSRIIITLNVYLEFPRWEFLLLVGEQLYSCCYCLVVNRLLNAMAWESVSYLCMYYSSVDITKFPLWEFCSLLFRRPVFSCFFHSQRDPHILFWTRRLFGSNLQFFFDLSAPCGQCSFHCVCLQNKKPQFPPWELRPVNQLCALL